MQAKTPIILTAAALALLLGIRAKKENEHPAETITTPIASLEEVARKKNILTQTSSKTETYALREYHGLFKYTGLLRPTRGYSNNAPNPPTGYFDNQFNGMIRDASNGMQPDVIKLTSFIEYLSGNAFINNSPNEHQDDKNAHHGELILPGTNLEAHYDIHNMYRGDVFNLLRIYGRDSANLENRPRIDLFYTTNADGTFKIKPSLSIYFNPNGISSIPNNPLFIGYSFQWSDFDIQSYALYNGLTRFGYVEASNLLGTERFKGYSPLMTWALIMDYINKSYVPAK